MINSITNSSTRLIALAIGTALVASVAFGSFAAPVKAAMTESQIQSIISLLQSFGADQATINNVSASLRGQATPGTGTGTGTGGACPALTRSLQQGSTGADVKALQVFLNSSVTTQVSTSGAGSPGSESTYFGPATHAAVVKFQAANNVSPIGIVGPATRAAIAAVCGTTGGGTTTPTGPGLTVMAAAQPANALAPQGAARVPFTTLTLKNNSGSVATVNGITVERVGLGIDSNFSGVVLIDAVNNVQLGTAKTLNSNHQAVIGDSFTINPGETKTLTIAGNISSNTSATAGQIVSLQVVGVNATVPVAGTLPIMGASHTINNTLTLGGVSTTSSSYDPGANAERNIGDTAVRFSGIRFTASSAEDLKLFSIRWRQTGTASAADISNVQTFVNGTAYPATIDSTGKYYTTMFSGGITIPKGNSIDVYVQGDLTGTNSAERSVSMDIDKVTDVYFVGQNYGYGVAPSGTFTPWYNGYTVDINPGTVTLIGKANEVAAQNIAPGVSNQVLGGFVTNFAGESVSIQGMTLAVSTSSTFTAGPITGVTIVNENGAVVAGPVDASANGATVTFTDNVTFMTGRHVYTVKGKVPSQTTNNATIYLSTTPSSWSNPVGQTSGNTITIGTGAFDMNTMTVKAGTLSVTAGSQPAAQNIVAGVQGYTFATIQLDASQSGEDVRISGLPLYFTGATLDEDLTGCQLYDGSTALTTGSRVVNTVTTATAHNFSLDNSLTVAKGTVKTLDVKCNVGTGAASTDNGQWGVSSSDGTWSATGVTSGTSISVSVTTTNSGLMTVNTGSVAVSVDASSPSYTTVAAGSTGVTASVIKVRASNENVSLTKLGLSLTNSDGSDAYNDVLMASIYDGATLVGTAYFTGNNETATSTFNSAVTLTKDTDKILTVKVNLAGIGSGQSGTAGKLIKVDPINAEGSGLSSGTTHRVGATGSSAGFRAFKSYPTIALDTLPTTGLADGKLMRFKVTANSAGPVGLQELTFTVSSTTGVTITNVGLYAYSDSSYSSPISGQGTSGLIGSAVTASITSGTAFAINPQTNPVAVPAGETRYFELRASITGVDSGDSTVTVLNGDSAYPTVLTSGYYTATSSALTAGSTFIWTGNSTTTATTADVDWANGYGVPGLPSSGLIQTRSN